VVRFKVSHFTPRDSANGIHWAEGWVGLKDSLDVANEENAFIGTWNRTTILLSASPVTTLTWERSRCVERASFILIFIYVAAL